LNLGIGFTVCRSAATAERVELRGAHRRIAVHGVFEARSGDVLIDGPAHAPIDDRSLQPYAYRTGPAKGVACDIARFRRVDIDVANRCGDVRVVDRRLDAILNRADIHGACRTGN
jgi:hypothetical protein